MKTISIATSIEHKTTNSIEDDGNILWQFHFIGIWYGNS